jgi:hypothetical protein
MLMKNNMFSTKIFECMTDILLPIICAYILDIMRGLLLNKILEGIKSVKDLTLELKYTHEERREKSSIKVSAYLALENE